MQPDDRQDIKSKSTWGPKLFLTVLVVILVFFWWLLIYPHGVAPHH